MQYIFLKGLVSGILSHFVCPECKTKATEASLSFKLISEHGADIEFTCPKCGIHTIMKATLGKVPSEFLHTDSAKSMIKKAIKENRIIFSDSTEAGMTSEEISRVEDILSKNPTIHDLMNYEQDS